MTCGEMTDLLSGWLDGELDAGRSRAVFAHLSECARCRREGERLAEESRRLRAAGRRLPEPPSWERLAGRLANSTPRPEPELPHPPLHRLAPVAASQAPYPGARRRRIVRFLAAAAAILTLAAAGALFFSRAFRIDSRGAPASGAAVPYELVKQLADPLREPDFRGLGAVRTVSLEGVGDLARDVQFNPLAPATLPGGYAFDGAWVLRTQACRMICMRFRKEGRILALVQSASTGGAPICPLSGSRCCIMGGMTCRRSRTERLDVVQTTHEGLALTVAARTGETDMDAVMTSLRDRSNSRRD